MSDVMLAAFISAVVTLMVNIVTLVTNIFVERFKSKSEIQRKEYQSKRERLNEVYKE